MTRPTVTIPTPNEATRLREHLATQLPAFQAIPGVMGITLNGGLSRGYGDYLSEIDVTLFLEPQTYAAWRQGQAPITLGIAVRAGQLYDLKALDLAAEAAKDWSLLERWDASYAQVLYDPDGRIAALLAAKVGDPPSPADAEGVLFRCWWYYRLACDIWLYRQDALQGHALAQQAVLALVEALFLANGEFVPHEKWLIHFSRTLAWTPDNWVDRLRFVLSTGDLSLDSLRTRQAAIERLWLEIDGYIKRQVDPDLPVYVMQRGFYHALAHLVAAGVLTHAQWEAHLPLSLLNHAPFHDVVVVTDTEVRLLPHRMAAVQPNDLYEWHYAVLDAARRLPGAGNA